MSRKIHADSPRAAGAPSVLRVVSHQNGTGECADVDDKLWQALHAHPRSSAAELAGAAKIGKSTAHRVLARWAADGSVARIAHIADGGRRLADLWTITDTEPEADGALTVAPQATRDEPGTWLNSDAANAAAGIADR